MSKVNNYIKFIANQKRGKIAFLLLALAMIPQVLWINRTNLPKSSLLGFDINNLFSLDLGSLNLTFLKVWFIISPVVLVSIFELFRNRQRLRQPHISANQGTRRAARDDRTRIPSRDSVWLLPGER